MFQVIWELKVKFKEREKFEQFYDPKGEWVKFFSKSPDYLGTDVLESGEGDGISISSAYNIAGEADGEILGDNT